MSEQDKRAVSICEAMADIPRATSPRTPLVWAYEVKAQRDELLEAANAVRYADSRKEENYALDALYKVIDKVEKTL